MIILQSPPQKRYDVVAIHYPSGEIRNFLGRNLVEERANKVLQRYSETLLYYYEVVPAGKYKIRDFVKE